MTEPMTPERLAEVRRLARFGQVMITGQLLHEILDEVDRLTSPPTHDERQNGLSDGHSESYRLGWRAGQAQAQAEVERLQRDLAIVIDQANIARNERDRLLARVEELQGRLIVAWDEGADFQWEMTDEHATNDGARNPYRVQP